MSFGPFGGNGGNDDPFKEFENIFRRAFGPFGPFQPGVGGFSGFSSSSSGNSSFSRSFGNGTAFESTSRGSYVPAANVADTGAEYVVDLDVPGIAREELKVTASAEKKICISGQRRSALNDMLAGQQQKSASSSVVQVGTAQPQSNTQHVFPLLQESQHGLFERCFSFPKRIDESKIQAHHNNGVLNLQIPHAEADDAGKTINIR